MSIGKNLDNWIIRCHTFSSDVLEQHKPSDIRTVTLSGAGKHVNHEMVMKLAAVPINH